MDYGSLVVGGIILLVVLLLLTVLVLVLYSGLLDDVSVEVGQPPLSEGFVGFYKAGTGSYKNSSFVFSEALSILPKLKTFGIFYDDPKEVDENNLRWIAGSVVPKTMADSDEMLEAWKVFEENGFKKFEFPCITNALKSKFPFRSDLSIMLGAYRVYPQLKHFAEGNKLKAHPFIEYYGDEYIHYFAPLCDQQGFYVDGIVEKTARPKED